MTDPGVPLVLVVEDEAAQAEVLRYNLQAAGYAVEVAPDGDEALLLAAELAPDAVLLDWMLPGVSGIEICRRLRARGFTSPILMLSARGEEADRIRGLDTGADDYLPKPYSVAEVLARLKACLRRSQPHAAGEVLRDQGLEIDTAAQRVSMEGRAVALGPTEYRLLVTLVEARDRVLTRSQLLDRVWGRDSETDTRTVDVHIGRLRKALDAGGAAARIETVRGSGYVYRGG